MVKNVINVGLVIFALAPVPASMAADMGPEVMTDAAMDAVTAGGVSVEVFANASADELLNTSLANANISSLSVDTGVVKIGLAFGEGTALGTNPSTEAGGSIDGPNNLVNFAANVNQPGSFTSFSAHVSLFAGL